jgi:hypothetical protein
MLPVAEEPMQFLTSPKYEPAIEFLVVGSKAAFNLSHRSLDSEAGFACMQSRDPAGAR